MILWIICVRPFNDKLILGSHVCSECVFLIFTACLFPFVSEEMSSNSRLSLGSRKNCIESQLKIKIYTKSSQVIKNRWPEDNIIVDDRISSWINDVDNLIPISPFNPCAKVTKGGQSVINMNLVYEYDDHEALSKLQNLLLEIGHKGNPRKELRKRFGLSEVVNILENSTSRHILEQNKK